jgi:hypothetical protein
MSWGDLYLHMIQGVAEKKPNVRTGFLPNLRSGRHAAAWAVMSAPHYVVTPGYWTGAQVALDVKAVYKNQRRQSDCYSTVVTWALPDT